MVRKKHIITESALVDLLRDKNPQGIEILYDNYSAAILGVLLKYVESSETAEDLLQETFLKVWKSFNTYDPEKGRLFTWLIRIAKNTALDFNKSKGVKKEYENVSLSSSLSYNHIVADETFCDEHIGLRQLVNELDDSKKQVIQSIYYKGLTQQEVALHLGIPLGTVKTRAKSGILALREFFKI